MIELIVGTNTSRDNDVVPSTMTVREALEAHNIDYSVGTIHLDGRSLRAGEMDQTFSELGITTKCSLISVVKGDAA